VIVRFLGQDEKAAKYIGSMLGIVYFPPYQIFGCLDRNAATGVYDLRGGYVLTGKSASNIDVSLYGRGCLTREAMSAVASHVFVTLGCQRATARCRRVNKEMRKYLERLGWTYEGCQRRYWGPTKFDDAMIYGLLPGNCRFVKEAK
jgi:RimJ/RimL family protein N-acetyltransferase